MLVKCNNVIPSINGVKMGYVVDPYNPLRLPPFTIRIRLDYGYSPVNWKGTYKQVSASPNIWDCTYVNTSWNRLFYNGWHGWDYLREVVGANTTDVTDMSSMFDRCYYLSKVALFDTGNVTTMNQMFEYVNNLTAVPEFNTSKVTNMASMCRECTSLRRFPLLDVSKVTTFQWMFGDCEYFEEVPLLNISNDVIIRAAVDYMFYNCTRVKSGALALYDRIKTFNLTHIDTFYNCGSNTVTGAAELAQIPDDWK